MTNPVLKKMSEKLSKKSIVTDDWTKNWQASIAVKITAVVMWVIIPFGFIIALILVNNIQSDITQAIDDDAEILLNSARILLSDNNSYNSSTTVKTLKNKLKQSVYCKINLVTGDFSPIVILANECDKQSKTIDKTYFFSTLMDDNAKELTLTLSHRPIAAIMVKYRSNIIVIMIIIVIVLGLVLTSVIRSLVLKPLLNMVAQTRQISEGNHDFRLILNQHDEFGYLAKFLNKMLDQVFEQQKNLKHANLELMKEVAERNRIALELAASRDQLEKLVQERTSELAVARDEALEANKAKSIFLANMSNEIRTPLNAILGYAQLLHRESGFSEKQLKSLKIIEESGNHLLELLNDVLDISKIEAGKMDLDKINFDLNDLLQGLSQMFQERCSDKGLLWHDQIELTGPVLVYSDPQKLRQILINLIGNAVKFTEQGDVSLRVKKTQNDEYLFEVSDTGPGIDNSYFDNIIKAFHQEKSGTQMGGTGLGLAITKRQLELLKSELKVTSTVGKGSVFSFTLKLKASSSGFEIRQEISTDVICLAATDSVKALVVDDIELSRNLLVDMLIEINAVVESASNGLEAIEHIQATEPEMRPDIVFMDINMPVMDGIEAVKKIKQLYGDAIVCVAVTGCAMEHSDEKYLRTEFDDYISKPYRFEAVFECMEKHLHINFQHGASVESHQIDDLDIDFKQCHVDEALCERLLEASKSYDLSGLKILLSELTSCGMEEAKAAQKLTHLMKQYDLKNMLALINRLSENTSETE